MKSKNLHYIVITILMCAIIGCSSMGNPVIIDQALTTDISDSNAIQSGTGILGAYSVALNPQTLDFEMTPLRSATIGESMMVDGITFFTWFPCSACIRLEGIQGDSNGINLDFYVSHPMQPGNTAYPPSGSNRLDLDVFDLAIVFWSSQTPTYFPVMNQEIYTDFCQNQTGYTTELANLHNPPSNAAVPYFLVVDDSISGTSTFNKFAMGQYKHTTVSIKSSSTMFYFTMYLTMGYGASATFWTRLTPKYYNPEFNRKAAWKVTATPQEHWPQDSFAPVEVLVEVYDWQQGATVYSNPSDYSNAPSNQIYSRSDVYNVTVDVLGMANWTFSSNTPVSGTGMPGDPLIYSVMVGNYNYLTNGTYLGIVKVVDTRVPETNLNNNRDLIVTSPDGRTLNKGVMPEYATYQTFTAIVG